MGHNQCVIPGISETIQKTAVYLEFIPRIIFLFLQHTFLVSQHDRIHKINKPFWLLNTVTQPLRSSIFCSGQHVKNIQHISTLINHLRCENYLQSITNLLYRFLLLCTTLKVVRSQKLDLRQKQIILLSRIAILLLKD